MYSRRAFPLSEVSKYSKWPYQYSGAVEEKIVYLQEDYIVFENFFDDKKPLFSDITQEWVQFCNTNLGFESSHIKLHPMNTHFSWKRAEGPFKLLTQEQANFYDEYGYLCLDDVFDAKTIQKITAEIDKLESGVENALRQMKEGKAFIARADEITFSTHLVRHSKILREFCSSLFFQQVCNDLIGPNVRLYWDHAVYKKPGVLKPFPWHQDNGYTFVEPQQYITCWVALTDANEENGCFWVTPRMHQLGTLHHDLTELGHVCYHENPKGAIPLPIKAGGVIIMPAILPHMTGPNYTQITRKGYVIQYATDGSYARTLDNNGKEIHILANTEERQFPILINGEAAIS